MPCKAPFQALQLTAQYANTKPGGTAVNQGLRGVGGSRWPVAGGRWPGCAVVATWKLRVFPYKFKTFRCYSPHGKGCAGNFGGCAARNALSFGECLFAPEQVSTQYLHLKDIAYYPKITIPSEICPSRLRTSETQSRLSVAKAYYPKEVHQR